MLTVCVYVIHSDTDVHTICYISSANIPLVATQLATFVLNKDLAVWSRAARYKESEPKASGSKGFRTPMGVIAIDSQ